MNISIYSHDKFIMDTNTDVMGFPIFNSIIVKNKEKFKIQVVEINFDVQTIFVYVRELPSGRKPNHE